ncbi:MAG TPA: inorganic diphosphatase [Candidatus Saccharimonadales bacterium]|nr:inorganic diphosphatase [Candidatus Saccharimonadales bacterium]
MNFHDILETGDYQNGIVNTVIEIPKGSVLKLEYEAERGCFFVDRVEPSIFPKPANYGFIPKTLDEDGDALDTLVVTVEPVPTGAVMEVKILGVLNFEDDGEMDYKIICVASDDRTENKRLESLDDLGEQWKKEVEFHFNHYKDLKKPGTTKVLGYGDAEEAKKIIAESIERWNNK